MLTIDKNLTIINRTKNNDNDEFFMLLKLIGDNTNISREWGSKIEIKISPKKHSFNNY